MPDTVYLDQGTAPGNINLTAGVDEGSYGNIVLQCGPGPQPVSFSASAGGMSLYGSDAIGGTMSLSFHGGGFYAQAGYADEVGMGGNAYITSGNGGDIAGHGGEFHLVAGDAWNAGLGGSVRIWAGDGEGTGWAGFDATAGSIDLLAGDAGEIGLGGRIAIVGGSGGYQTSGGGGTVNIIAGSADAQGEGGYLWLASGGGVNGNGGDITLSAGLHTGTGRDGAIMINRGLKNFANDAAAATGGIPINGLYRNGSAMMIRVA